MAQKWGGRVAKAADRGDGQDEPGDTFGWEDDSDTREISEEHTDKASPEHAFASRTSHREEEQPLCDRLEQLSHGAGPSRRRRHLTGVGNNVHLTKIGLKGAGAEKARQGAAEKRGKKGKTARLLEEERETDTEKSSSSKSHGRANKNRPQEVSSLRAVGRFREVVVSKRETSRDPRFEGGGGSSKLNYDIFRKAYGFLEGYQDSEIEELKKTLKKEKNQERSSRLRSLLTRLQQERAERSQGDRTLAALRQAKMKERQAVADGKKPYYLKNSEKKKISFEQRYEELKEQGKLGKFIEKKRKRNAAKEHRWLPAKRQDRG